MNPAILCLIVAAMLPVACAGIAKWGFRDFDNRQPRDWLARQSGFRARANAAQANSWEALAVFAPAVVLAIGRGDAPATVNALALTFVALRIGFIACYLADRSTLRSLAWLGGYAASLALMVVALGE